MLPPCLSNPLIVQKGRDKVVYALGSIHSTRGNNRTDAKHIEQNGFVMLGDVPWSSDSRLRLDAKWEGLQSNIKHGIM